MTAVVDIAVQQMTIQANSGGTSVALRIPITDTGGTAVALTGWVPSAMQVAPIQNELDGVFAQSISIDVAANETGYVVIGFATSAEVGQYKFNVIGENPDSVFQSIAQGTLIVS